MHDELWAGAEMKSQHATFFLEKMGAALLPPERTAINVANRVERSDPRHSVAGLLLCVSGCILDYEPQRAGSDLDMLWI
jgi:hypothetical protein